MEIIEINESRVLPFCLSEVFQASSRRWVKQRIKEEVIIQVKLEHEEYK